MEDAEITVRCDQDIPDAYAEFARVAVVRRDDADGTVQLDNRLPLPAATGTLPDRLDHWSRVRPEAVFLSEPRGEDRRSISYGMAAVEVARLTARLLSLPVSADRPLMIVGANGITHALIMLAAMRVAIPVAPVSPAYCSEPAAPWAKFSRLLGLVEPGFVVSDDPDGVTRVLDHLGRGNLPVGSLVDTGWTDSLDSAPEATVTVAAASVTGETLAKLMFTSGSTGAPKAVMNTQSMMMSNMAGLGVLWPFLHQKPPVLVDWLPWSHIFGGNCCFNIALYFGGTLHIDDGRPLPDHIGRTVTALKNQSPTAYFNVPAGYETLIPHLEAEPAFAARFLGGLDVMFNAAAALPSSLRARYEALARKTVGRSVPIAGGWGSTETAPFSTVLYFDTPHASNLGVPLPGTTVKLVPWADSFELRVRGPNVMPGYWRQPEATLAAFDEDGFYRIGDAGTFVDDARPELGILFDGRVAENFKLSTGTWVNVGALRLALISALSPFASDIVIAGEGRDELAALIFCNRAECVSLLGRGEWEAMSLADLVVEPVLLSLFEERLKQYNADQSGSSTRIARFALLAEPPSALHDEMTDKGYLNQRAVLRRRHSVVEQVFAASDERV